MSDRVQKNHREMYKARTPPWKETYRKRCIERLKGSREKLQARFRKINNNLPADDTNTDTFIEDLMREELKRLRGEQGREDQTVDMEGLYSVDVDEVITLFEDIQDELRSEEQKMLEEMDRYEHSLVQEEQSLCSAVEKLCAEEVVCPLCQKNPLLVNKSVIFCRCGLRIDTEQDCLTLSNVKLILHDNLQQHGTSCDCEPKFSIISEITTNNLMMSCSACDWMSVII